MRSLLRRPASGRSLLKKPVSGRSLSRSSSRILVILPDHGGVSHVAGREAQRPVQDGDREGDCRVREAIHREEPPSARVERLSPLRQPLHGLEDGVDVPVDGDGDPVLRLEGVREVLQARRVLDRVEDDLPLGLRLGDELLPCRRRRRLRRLRGRCALRRGGRARERGDDEQRNRCGKQPATCSCSCSGGRSSFTTGSGRATSCGE